MNRLENIEIGDLVKCVTSISVTQGGPTKGECFIVTAVDDHAIGFPLKRLNEQYNSDVKRGLRVNWGIFCFELVSKNSAKAAKVLFSEK